MTRFATPRWFRPRPHHFGSSRHRPCFWQPWHLPCPSWRRPATPPPPAIFGSRATCRVGQVLAERPPRDTHLDWEVHPHSSDRPRSSHIWQPGYLPCGASARRETTARCTSELGGAPSQFRSAEIERRAAWGFFTKPNPNPNQTEDIMGRRAWVSSSFRPPRIKYPIRPAAAISPFLNMFAPLVAAAARTGHSQCASDAPETPSSD